MNRPTSASRAPGVAFDDVGIHDPRLEFVDGVAAIDMYTLRRAAETIAAMGCSVQLPTIAQVVLPAVFDELCHVHATPDFTVTATIATGVMGWYNEEAVTRGVFVDYTGVSRYGVVFQGAIVHVIGGTPVFMRPAFLGNGQTVYVWCAELLLDTVSGLKLYELYSAARTLAENLGQGRWVVCREVVIPAQRVRWERYMSEIVAANPMLRGAVQKALVDLTEKGVQVTMETSLEMGRVPIPTVERWVLGERGPVIVWLTADTSTEPFAVLATTCDAWLAPHTAFAPT